MAAENPVGDGLLLVPGHLQQLAEINAGVVSHVVEHIHQVLRGQITGGTGRERTASQPAQGGLDRRHTTLDGRQGIHHAHIAGVVDMHLQGHLGIRLLHGADCLPHLPGIRHADGVAEVDLLHQLRVRRRESHSRLHRQLPLKGAAERGGQVQADMQVRVILPDLPQLRQGLGMGTVDVGPVVALTQGHYVGDLADAALPGQLRPSEIRYQRQEIHVVIPCQACLRHLPGIPHLRDRLGTDKGGHLHMPDPRLDDAVNNAQFLIHGNIVPQVLEAIPGTHFINVNHLFHNDPPEKCLFWEGIGHFDYTAPGLDLQGKFVNVFRYISARFFFVRPGTALISSEISI